MNNKYTQGLNPVGWREWVAFPEWGIDHLKAKVDTGAKTSSIHVENLIFFEKDNKPWVKFSILPWQKSSQDGTTIEAPVLFEREIKSSSGCLEKRPIISAMIKLSHKILKIELSLTDRDQMGIRMLLGREALNDEFYVISGKSYLNGKPPKEIRQKNRGRQ